MTTTAAELAARLDRLPMTRHIWYLVTLISLGGCFELYDLFLTAYIAPGLNQAGYFTPESLGVFNILGPIGVAGIGTFVFALFAGLFVGAICLGHVADHYGRRTVFTFSLVWYSITTAIMAFQTSGFGVDLWRFIAGIGIGVELVTIDTYVAELVPLTHRGRAFAYNQFFQFLAVPIMAFIAWLLVPTAPFGFDGWRWVVLIGSAGAIVIWFIRLACRNRRAGWRVTGGSRRPNASPPASRRGRRRPGRHPCRRRARCRPRRTAKAGSPRSGSRPTTGAPSCCPCSTSSRPSAITALPPGCRRC